jgi:hypothetical protein
MQMREFGYKRFRNKKKQTALDALLYLSVSLFISN